MLDFSFSGECLGVVNVEAHAASHCRMAKHILSQPTMLLTSQLNAVILPMVTSHTK